MRGSSQCQCHHFRGPSAGRRRLLSRFRRGARCRRLDRRPATPMSARPTRQHFLARRKTKALFRRIFAMGKGKRWDLSIRHVSRFPGRKPPLPLHALGHADPQCFRLAEALLSARRRPCRRLQGADGDDGLGSATEPARHEKCANCMAHCGYEATAADATLRHPLAALGLALRGLRTQGPMAPELVLRPRHAPPIAPQVLSQGAPIPAAEVAVLKTPQAKT